MVLSSERESAMVEKNMKKIYRAVDSFMARCDQEKGVQLSYDDCVQEASIAFLLYIRRCKEEKELIIFPYYDIIHALSELVLRSQPMKVPIKTERFNRIIHSLPSTVSYDLLLSTGLEVDGMSKYWVVDKNTEIDFDTFMSEQSELVQRIISMRLYGMTYRDIAEHCNVSKSLVEKIIRKLRENYHDFHKEEHNDE